MKEYHHNVSFKRESNRRYTNTTTDRGDCRLPHGDASWSTASPEDMVDYLGRLTDGGACCIFSKSTDGGVLSVTVIYGGERWRAWPRNGDLALVALRDIVEDLGM